ncbi:MAG: UDP-3-O-(3-hydroxymyristoyl)glucosamine N-acyltransferase [Alphaproteobacteria bacterium]|nr:UDP-3-O-(3-hydroxymyristoyl)glucosamine N-acyltransferase [Alphaproteobacteria bacterium]
MPDPRFFRCVASFTLQQIAELSGSKIASGCDPDFLLEDIAPLDTATERNLSFLDNVKYKEHFAKTRAGACFVSLKYVDIAPKGLQLLISEEPYKAYALAAQAFYPEENPKSKISKNSHVHTSAKIAEGCIIEAGAVIADGVELGKGCWVEANAVISQNVIIGNYCRIGANATVSHSIISDYVRLYPGARIGQDGFGFAIDNNGHIKVPQLGRVIIESHVEIGANTTIDRGAGSDTVIGQGTWIDNLVQIAHNVKIGKGCVIVAQVGISGSVVIEDFVVFAGQSAIAGHLTVGSGAKIGAQSGVMRDVPSGETQIGTPSMPAKQFMRQVAALKRLVKR